MKKLNMNVNKLRFKYHHFKGLYMNRLTVISLICDLLCIIIASILGNILTGNGLTLLTLFLLMNIINIYTKTKITKNYFKKKSIAQVTILLFLMLLTILFK